MKKKEPFNIKNINPRYLCKRDDNTVTSKLRLQDAIKWHHKGEERVDRIYDLIKSYPIALWNMIHQVNSKVSLVRTAYAKLKTKIDPSLIEEVKKKHEKRKAVRQLKREIANGFINAKNSRFKKISSVKVVK